MQYYCTSLVNLFMITAKKIKMMFLKTIIVINKAWLYAKVRFIGKRVRFIRKQVPLIGKQVRFICSKVPLIGK